MTSTSARRVAKLSTPGDIVASIPSLCGFLPTDSVVVLSLREPRRRLGLVMRLDLPPRRLVGEAARSLVARVAQDGGQAAVVAVFGSRREQALVDAVLACAAEAEIEVADALHVVDGRWTSYLCRGPCCPPDGTAVGVAPTLLQAEQALDGRVVLASREELVRSLVAPADPLGAVAARVAAARTAWQALAARDGLAAARAAGLRQARAATTLVAGGGAVDAATAAELAVLLHDVRARDEIATWALSRGDAVLALAEQVARQVGPPGDAPVCTLLAWVAYSRGDGARANIALDRALGADPQYSLALLLQAALDGGLPPEQVQRTMAATARAHRRRR